MRRAASAFIRLDLPTFDRPTSAISGRSSLGNPDAPAAFVTTSALTLKRLEGREEREGHTKPSCLSCPSSPSCRLVSNGVVDDGAVDRRRLCCGGQTSNQRFSQRDLQDLVHRLDM